MLKNLWNNLLMFPEGDSGGSGGGSLATSSQGGSGTGDSQGGAGAASGAGANGASGNAGNAGAAAGGTSSDWKSTLPKELQEDATLKKFTSVDALAGAYLNAQKLIGKDKISVPGKESGDDEWRNVFTKLGLPETEDKYEVKFKDGVQIDEEFSKDFKKQAYKMGILPKQAQALAEWFSDINLQSEQKISELQQASVKKNIEGLQKEWGDAYKQNLSRVHGVVKTFGDKDFNAYLDKTGLGNDPQLIKFLSKIGEKMFAEGKIVGDVDGKPTMTPTEAQKAIMDIMGKKEHPYYIKDHPAHKTAVEEVLRLQELKLASKKQG